MAMSCRCSSWSLMLPPSSPLAQPPCYRYKEKTIKEPRSKGQKRGTGKGYREQNKQQKCEQVLVGEVS